MKKRKRTSKYSVAVVFGLMLLITFVLCVILGSLVKNQIVPENAGEIIGIGLAEVVTFLGCWIIAKQLPKKRMLAALVAALLLCGLRLLFGVMLGDGEGLLITRCLLTLGIGTAAGLCSGMKKERRR